MTDPDSSRHVAVADSDVATPIASGDQAPPDASELEVDLDRTHPVKLSENRDFLKFWAGETVSLFGSQVTVLALPLAAVVELDVDARELGFLQFLQFIAFGVLAMPLGVWADRRRKKPIMIGTNAVRALLIFTVPLMAVFDVLSLNALYVVALSVSICTVLFDVCWMSYVPTVVADDKLRVEANGRLGMSLSASQLAGPSLGGVLVQVFTAPITLVIDALSYVVSVFSLLAIRAKEPSPSPRRSDSTFIHELGEGLRWVFGNTYLRILATVGSLFNFFIMFTQAIFLLFAVRTLSLPTGFVGMILSAGAVGGLLGAAVAGRATRRFPLGRVYQVATVTSLCSFILIPMAAGPEWLAIAILVVAYFVILFGLSIANVVSISLRQAVTPPALMARMNAAMRTSLYGIGAIGALTGGFVGAAVGLRPALWIAAVGAIGSTLPMFVSSLRHVRTLPQAARD